MKIGESENIAEMWYCGDDICNCHQPQINKYTMRENGFYKMERLWEGTFHSDPDLDEMESMKLELEEAKKRFGIV